MTPYNPATTQAELTFNRRLSSVRMSVELGMKGMFAKMPCYSDFLYLVCLSVTLTDLSVLSVCA